jgi:hypothetical protein
MKKVHLFEDYLTEGLTFDVNVQEPFDKKDEQKAQKQFKIEAKPITMIEVDGDITEDSTDIAVVFSNGDSAVYTYQQRNSNSGTMVISPKDASDINVTNQIDSYFGSTGTVIGDIGLIYKDWKQGKIK